MYTFYVNIPKQYDLFDYVMITMMIKKKKKKEKKKTTDNNYESHQGGKEKQWPGIFSRPMAITGLQGRKEMDGPSQCSCGLFICDFLSILNLYRGNCLFEVFLLKKLQSF
jgi:hypothetical protein